MRRAATCHARERARRRRTAALAAVVTGAALALVVPAPTTAAASTHCRKPVVRDVMISQGLPSYRELARGKTALLKLFLSEASSTDCSNVSSESIAITGGRLTVDNGSLQPPVVSLDVPTSGALPEFSGYDVAPVTATPADPRFAVDGKHLTSANPAHAATTFPVVFKVALDYVTKNSKTGAVVESGTLVVTQRPGGGVLSAVVSKPVKPMRLLVVPMGDATVTTPVQFPTVAATEVASGIAAISRLLPVPDGVDSLKSGAGLRWGLSAGMVNLGPHVEFDPPGTVEPIGAPKTVDYMPGGKYCGGGGRSFDYIQNQLAGFRSAWNAENPTAPVDRVLGVIWKDVSAGDATGDGPGCAEGYAGMGGTISWARIVPASTARRGITGSIGALELMHGFGGSVVSVKQGPSGPQEGAGFPHSFSERADGTAPHRAYNVPERAFLDGSTNRSVMDYDRAPWDDYTTLFEKADWDFALCFLTTTSRTPSQDCGSPASSGAGISAAGGSYVLSGSTDGTAEGTDAHTYFDGDMPRDGTDAGSAHRLVQRTATGATTGSSTGVLMVEDASAHSDAGSTSSEGRLAFDVAIPQQAGAVAFELWRGEPGSSGSVRLLRRQLDAQAPQFVSTGTAPAPSPVVRYTADGTSRQPAVSADGELVAFTSPAGVVVARTGADTPRSNAVLGEQAAWRPDGQELAFVRDGEVYLVSVSVPVTGAPSIGVPRKVYGSRVGTGTPPASRPTYSPDAAELALSVNGDLFAVNLRLLTPDAYPVLCPLDALVQDATTTSSGLACRRLTATADAETAPAWSSTTNTIAYVRTATGASTGRIWTLSASAATTSAAQRLAADGQSYGLPAWAGGRLLVTTSGGLLSVDATTFTGTSRITSSPDDTWPTASGAGGRVMFARSSGTASDLFSFGLTQQTATATVQDDNPQSLRMDLFVVCGSTADPVVVAARPSSVDAASGHAHFDLRFDSSRSCAAGQLLYRVTDGYQVTRELGASVPGQGRASSAIYLPKPDAVVLQYDTIPVAGAAKRASGEATDQIAWTLTGPKSSKDLGTGTVLPDVVAPTGGWTPGTWTVTAVPDGDASAATVRVFTIVADTDGDGIPDTADTRTVHGCFPEDAATNAGNALADPDGDLVVSLLDPDPCRSAMNASVLFRPETLNLVSSGTPITMTLTTSAFDVRKLKLSEVVISQIGGFTADLPAYALSASSATTVEAKFARQDFIDFFNSRGLRGYVPVVMSATHAGTAARGFDPTAPVYQPS